MTEKTESLLTEIKSSVAQLEQAASAIIRCCGAASVFIYQLEKELKEQVKGKGEGQSDGDK